MAGSEPPISTRELDRLWDWGLHEDELLVNRMSVSLLAQSILLVAAVGILTAANAGMADRIVEIVLDIVGLTITVSLWHVFTLHAAHIKVVGQFEPPFSRRHGACCPTDPATLGELYVADLDIPQFRAILTPWPACRGERLATREKGDQDAHSGASAGV